MSTSVIYREELHKSDQVYFCSTHGNFDSNWTEWYTQDCNRFEDIHPDNLVFGVIRNGLFSYVPGFMVRPWFTVKP